MYKSKRSTYYLRKIHAILDAAKENLSQREWFNLEHEVEHIIDSRRDDKIVYNPGEYPNYSKSGGKYKCT